MSSLTQVGTIVTKDSINENLLLNGDMKLWQRGGFGNLDGTPAYTTADRWATERSGGGSATASDSGSSLSEFNDSLRLYSSDSTAKNLFAWQRIEGNNFRPLIGETVHIGVWVWIDTSAPVILQLVSNDNGYEDEWSSAENYGNTFVVSENFSSVPLSTWTYISTTATITSACTSGAAFGVRFGTLEATGSIYITGARIHKGGAELPWKAISRDSGRELALCRRFFLSFPQWMTLPGHAKTTSGGFANIAFPVEMRNTPSFSYNSTIGNYYVVYRNANTVLTSLSGNVLSKSSALLNFTCGTVLTIGDGVFVYLSGANAKLFFDAEI